MSLPKFFSNPYFQPRHQVLYQTMNPVLKMLTEISQAAQAFLILWEEDYHQLYDVNKEFHAQISIDSQLFKDRFSKLNQEVIYVPNVKLHTLFQEIDFFKTHLEKEQLIIYPIVDHQNKVKGLLGGVLPASVINDFDAIVKRMESVGNYTNQLYFDYLDQQKSSLPNYLNLENLPASFFEIEFGQNHELLYCNYSKTLIRNHPAFSKDCSDEEKANSLLGMTIKEFYGLISKVKTKQTMEYVYSCPNQYGDKKYFLIKLHISEINSDQYRCLGVVEDFTVQKAYSSVLDQMIFDISHVMRRPVVTMKGLTNLIDMDVFDREELREITNKIKVVSDEMEEYIGAMFKIYDAKQEAIYHL